ncbi:CIA30 family protein [Mycolicibacterium sp. BiH015]|uniref:CIA30 family protein n=1 Tax=Mycolicibacterium sp. BiH015 TaxID=3018808 RepID=UPI0022E4F492|nr:CIA30 family protein [Mycolicibacterium sp. BiH015]MDA2892152.1 CIA30 family protein [Mycolicibacterium sp. BiH015]
MTTSAPSTAAASEVVLVDLSDADEAARWTTVNDPVMGGKSTSRITFAEGGLVFSGTISLANNGGFASARGPQNPEIGRRATGAGSLRVNAVGDGKTYLLKVGEAGQAWSYVQRFATEPGVGRGYDLPVSGFEPVGQRLDPEPSAPATLDPSTINQISLYILDKQQGPFEITVSALDAVF